MKIKTINKIIREKVVEWLATITDKDLLRDLKRKVIVTGGCITSMLQGDDVNDFDIYFMDREITFRVAKYYVEIANKHFETSIRVEIIDRVRIIIPSKGVVGEQPQEREEFDGEEVEEKELDPYFPIHLSENAITLTDKVQLITRFYGEPSEIHKNYDFVHCTNYWTRQTKLVTNVAALESILTKELHYVGSLYPLCSIIRTRKFVGRGWRIHAGQYLKMCFQLSLLDLTDIEVLRDQLTGVDAAYFHAVIHVLEAAKETDENFDMTSEYLCEVVDRIFN